MKTISQILNSLLMAFLLTSTLMGQVNQTRLNQGDLLLKHQVGLWQTDPKKDTVFYADSRPFGKGVVETDWMEVKGKTVAEYYVSEFHKRLQFNKIQNEQQILQVFISASDMDLHRINIFASSGQ